MLKKTSKAKISAVVASLIAAPSVFAADGAFDYSTLTSAVDFTSVGVAIMGVAAALAVVYAGVKGVKLVLAFLR